MSPGLCVHFERRYQALAASGMLFPPSPLSKPPQTGSNAGSVEMQTSSAGAQVVQIDILSLHSSAAALACSELSFPWW